MSLFGNWQAGKKHLPTLNRHLTWKGKMSSKHVRQPMFSWACKLKYQWAIITHPPPRKAKILTIKNTKSWWERGTQRHLILCWQRYKWYSHFGRFFPVTSKMKHSCHLTHQFHFLVVPLNRLKICLHKSVCVNVCSSFTCNYQNLEVTKCSFS